MPADDTPAIGLGKELSLTHRKGTRVVPTSWSSKCFRYLDHHFHGTRDAKLKRKQLCKKTWSRVRCQKGQARSLVCSRSFWDGLLTCHPAFRGLHLVCQWLGDKSSQHRVASLAPFGWRWVIMFFDDDDDVVLMWVQMHSSNRMDLSWSELASVLMTVQTICMCL